RFFRRECIIIKGDVLAVIDDGSGRAEVVRFLITKLYKIHVLGIRLVLVPASSAPEDFASLGRKGTLAQERATKVLVPITLDEVVQDFLGEIFSGKEKKAIDNVGGVALYGVFEEVLFCDVQAYGKLRGIAVQDVRPADPFVMQVRAFIETIEERYPGTMYSLKQSADFWRAQSFLAKREK
ncbi:hypothetical protein COY95_03915, partial [Candidatus Woesearchaeota archaeon CG_4_10_14_0_8_um_filter_47_5]